MLNIFDCWNVDKQFAGRAVENCSLAVAHIPPSVGTSGETQCSRVPQLVEKLVNGAEHAREITKTLGDSKLNGIPAAPSTSRRQGCSRKTDRHCFPSRIKRVPIVRVSHKEYNHENLSLETNISFTRISPFHVDFYLITLRSYWQQGKGGRGEFKDKERRVLSSNQEIKPFLLGIDSRVRRMKRKEIRRVGAGRLATFTPVCGSSFTLAHALLKK